MCGIVGLFLKNERLQPELGRLTGLMLRELCDRGPDSAGFAVYDAGTPGTTKICAVSRNGAVAWSSVANELAQAIGAAVEVEEIQDHAIFRTKGAGDIARKWLIDNVPGAYVLSQGQSIEIFKGVGDPAAIVDRLALEKRAGTHAIGHTRMATESAVTVAGSHPFSTGDDTCLVHNGSLSNHNRLREQLVRHGERFQTDNDSEVAAAYLASRLRKGDSLEASLQNGLRDLDGFYTFVVGTRDGFAVIRDPIACKPAVIAETDDWAAMASEYRFRQ
jgi:amidophosphoribosyltransferase